MGKGIYRFNEKQKALILSMEVHQMIELFSITNETIADFLYAIHIQPKNVFIHPQTFHMKAFPETFEVGIYQNRLAKKSNTSWEIVPINYRLLGIYLSEQVHKNPFLFVDKPEIKKPKITVEKLFFDMALSDIGKTPWHDLLMAEIIPPSKERALQRAIERRKTKRQYTVAEIFTRMSLSRVGNLSISDFFNAEVFKKKNHPTNSSKSADK